MVDLKAPRILGSYPVVTHQENALNRPSNNVIWNYFLKEPDIDSTEVKQATHFTLEMADPKNVKASLYNGEHLLKTRLVKGKLKNGYFRLKHRLKWQGIPIIYWGLSSEKIQFGIGSEQQLYIDQSSTRNGGILIIISGTPDVIVSSTILPYKF
ncbi:hypothetical protein GCM10023149_10810 [Mucilaginibacter gynuensis]|uniref:Uncharacterized protein n=1 Tax=Mucilaginibacter gynuensis TaxID=1302236 RepID=A0ABP8G058_9SPHI